MPDHFDRLVARGTGLVTGAGEEGGPTAVPARPRLPLPFERPDLKVTEETVSAFAAAHGPAAGREHDPVRPAGPPASGPATPPPALVRLIRHETVLRERTERIRPAGPARHSAPPEEWRPATTPAPETPPQPREPARPRNPREESARPSRVPAAPRPRPPVPAVAASRASTNAFEPRRDQRLAAAHRETRPAERVVRVSIGRLEVTATGAPRQSAPDRPPSRRGPAMTLDRFLARRAGEDGRA
jgi:hypothetical protein